MRWIVLGVWLLTAASAGADAFDDPTTFTNVPASSRVEEIARRVSAVQQRSDLKLPEFHRGPAAVRPVAALTTASLSGRYSNPGPTLEGGLSGDDLYLFPDASFFFLKWADILPRTIYSRGSWQVENGYVTLHDDGVLSGTSRLRGVSRAWVPLSLTLGTSESVCLVGSSYHYNQLLSRMRPNEEPGFRVILSSLERAGDIPPSKAEELKASLMRNYWRPRYLAGQGFDKTEARW